MSAEAKKPKILMVTGKGGVGKSSIAAAKAKYFARQGEKTLLVELGQESYFQYLFGQDIGYQPQALAPNLYGCQWQGEDCLREFIGHYIRIKAVVNLFFENQVMRALVKAAPALRELAILGKLTSGIRQFGPQMNFDRIVVDAFATGHFLSLMRVPGGMAEAIKFGPMGEQSRRIHEVICDPEVFEILIVTLSEEMPRQEALELATDLKNQFSQAPKILLNRLLQIPLSLQQLEKLNDEEPEAQDFISYLKTIHLRQQESQKRITQSEGVFEKLPFFLEEQAQVRVEKMSHSL